MIACPFSLFATLSAVGANGLKGEKDGWGTSSTDEKEEPALSSCREEGDKTTSEGGV